jgi:trimethylamine-N-oxide reductase (cytochrome c)
MVGYGLNVAIEQYKQVDRSLQSPRIECGVAQTIFLENDALFADIVLPVCTQLEREDFGYEGHPYVMGRGSDVGNFVAVYMKPCVKPLYESKSDYEICRLVAERLGLEKEYTEGNTVEDWIRGLFDASCLPELVSFEEFKEKGYYVFKFPDDWERNPGLRRFYETGTGLKTPSGKIEFYSERLAQNFPNDNERPPCCSLLRKAKPPGKLPRVQEASILS